MEPVVTGLVGLGGYAGNICELLLNERGQAAQSGDPTVRLAGVVSSNPARHPERVEQLQKHGVAICPDYDALLALPGLEAVWLPLPIDMHLPYTRKALEAGKHVMLEKPVAGAIQDADELILLRERYNRRVLIGYQDMYDPATVEIKTRLLDGVIGKIRRATLQAVWPREYRYYHRNDWAGALTKNGIWVMDSPANNALAHFINIGLFFMGPTMEEGAQPLEVEAELYRANPIENFDTCSMRIQLAGDIPMLVCLTHAGKVCRHPTLVLEGDRGTLHWSFEGDIRLAPEPGSPHADRAYSATRDERPHRFMADRFNQLIRGIDNPNITMSTLENARLQTLVVNGASEADAVANIPDDQIETVGEGETAIRAVSGIEDAFEQCISRNVMLHESTIFPWTHPAGSLSLRHYSRFDGPKTA